MLLSISRKLDPCLVIVEEFLLVFELDISKVQKFLLVFLLLLNLLISSFREELVQRQDLASILELVHSKGAIFVHLQAQVLIVQGSKGDGIISKGILDEGVLLIGGVSGLVPNHNVIVGVGINKLLGGGWLYSQ